MSFGDSPPAIWIVPRLPKPPLCSFRRVSPPRIDSLLPDFRKLARALPELFTRLEQIARATSEMPRMRAGIDAVSQDTAQLAAIHAVLVQVRQLLENLPEIDRGVQAVAQDTDVLPAVRGELQRVAETTAVLATMDRRMEKIESSMPVLVEVQQHLSQLPESIASIGVALGRLPEMLDRLMTSVERLDDHVGALQEAMLPIARVADRLPGGRRPSG